MGNSTQTWDCARCGKRCERPRVKGQRPKWCSEECGWMARKTKTGTCAQCGAEYTGVGERFCSVQCARKATAKPKPPKVEYVAPDLRSPLRSALEGGDHDGVIAAIRALSARDADGCWIWSRQIRDGYPAAKVGKRYISVHRASLEAKLGAPLGSQHAHHICANTRCVNPDHLQPVTHRDNSAEMLARQSYIARIRELEDALAAVDPHHPLLLLLPVA